MSKKNSLYDMREELQPSGSTNGSPTVSASTADKDRKRMRRSAYIKMVAMVGIIGAILAYSSIAWFTQNKENNASGMGVKVGANSFELEVDDRIKGENGTLVGESELGENIAFHDNPNLYGSALMNFLHSLAVRTGIGDNGNTICWRMADGDDKMMPGSEGVLAFKVIPNKTLRYSLEYVAYTADTEELEENGQVVIDEETGLPVEIVTALHEINETSTQAEKDGVLYLKSHILFFTAREEVTTKVSGKTFYRYHGWIDDPSDFTMTPDQDGYVKIYWIWPNTFGQLALNDRTDSVAFSYLASTTSVLDDIGEGAANDSSSDRARITAYIKNTDNHIFAGSAGENTTYAAQLDALYNNRVSGVPYETLSDGYNSADQIIGKNLDYVMLKMKATAE